MKSLSQQQCTAKDGDIVKSVENKAMENGSHKRDENGSIETSESFQVNDQLLLDDFERMNVHERMGDSRIRNRSVLNSIATKPCCDLEGLSFPCIGASKRRNESAEEYETRLNRMADATKTILECIGEDVDRHGLLNTPVRFAKAMLFFTSGYTQSCSTVINNALFQEDHDEMVLVKDISFYSLCEHHLVPFFGKVHVAYIPNGKVLGLSKVARIVEMYSRRLQVQERLTKQIALAMMDILKPQGVAVIIDGRHMCMVMRGVQREDSRTTTSAMMGVFRDDPKTRDEVLKLLH